MHTLRARVVDGRIRLDEVTDLPEGSEVVLAVIDDEGIEAALGEALDDLAAGDEGVSAADVLSQLASR